MALFKTKLEKIKELYKSLDDDELTEFKEFVEDKVEDEPTEPETEEVEEKVEEVETEEDKVEEPVEDEVVEDEVKEEETETTEEPTEEEVEETEVEEEAKEEKEADVVEVMQAKMDDIVNQFNTFKDRVEKYLSKFDALEEGDQEIGLTKQENVEMGEDEDNMTAHEYAMKHAVY